MTGFIRTIVGFAIIAAEALGQMATDTVSSAGSTNRSASIQITDMVFPHLAIGGGWDTTLFLVNLGLSTVSVDIRFYETTGRPLVVSIRENGELNRFIRGSGPRYTLQPRESKKLELFDSSDTTQTGWASLTYTTLNARIGGALTFRQRVAGRPDFQAVAALSSSADSKFYMPFDNTEGFATAIAIANPSGTASSVTIEARSLDGAALSTKQVSLPAFGQTAFAVADLIPEATKTMGTLYVTSSTNSMSALGLRFDLARGFSFTSIPVMNWSGMFP